jgi:DNA-binding NtrC family response regulator
MRAPAVLVVDDDRSARVSLELWLEEQGYQTHTAEDGVEAMIELEEREFDVVVSDLRMPRMDGLELLSHVRQRWPALPVIIITAVSDVSEIVEAVQLGAINYLVKPSPPAAVTAAVKMALGNRDTSLRATGGVPELVGKSKSMVEVRHRVVLAARSDVPVLVTGETGTGKELVARAIHRHSKLESEPFIAHNCALALSELFESEFFGHRRGAFTGADRDHAGLLSRAGGGVLFLDELETLDPMHQAKLLRVMDDGEVRPVGSETVHVVSIRFIAATNREPMEMLRAGALREDLYYRLRGLEIRLPPLRERAEDIPLLVRHFLEREGPGPGLAPDAMQALVRASWPGNVRQLENAVRSARAAAGTREITARHLSLEGPAGTTEAFAPGAPSQAVNSLEEVERRAILDALRACDGNRSEAARRLGIDRSTLRRKLREYQLQGTD